MDKNNIEYYRNVYISQTFDRRQLLDLDQFDTQQKIIVVDSCAWYYQKIFDTHDIYKVEGIQTCKSMNLSRSQVDKMFDDQDLHNLKFPDLHFPNAVLLLDYSRILKYRTPEQLHNILNSLARSSQADKILVRLSMVVSDDNRFIDRLQNMSKITPAGYTVVSFQINFDVQHQPLVACFQKNKCHAKNFN